MEAVVPHEPSRLPPPLAPGAFGEVSSVAGATRSQRGVDPSDPDGGQYRFSAIDAVVRKFAGTRRERRREAWRAKRSRWSSWTVDERFAGAFARAPRGACRRRVRRGSWPSPGCATAQPSVHGISLALVTDAPRWTEARGPASLEAAGAWRPNAHAFGWFAAALATRYSGSYPDPLDPSHRLPRVRYFQAWAETS